ncbi:hypothetical protein NHP22001_03370 [Helicobacter sp. NHP22-001]|nr:hypothetical protein NHP22001_03370 [Helicobacter sp. NHP22-001]
MGQNYKWLDPKKPSPKLLDTLKTSFGLELFKGLGLTIKEFFSKEVTIHYPMEVLPLSPRYRAVHHLQRLLESGSERCIGCGLCEKICTSNCIRIITHKGEDERKYIDSYTINLGRCIYCGLCAEVCPELAIVMGQRFENSSVQRSQFGGKAEFLTDIESAKNHTHQEFMGFGAPSTNANERLAQTPLDYALKEEREEETKDEGKKEEAKKTKEAKEVKEVKGEVKGEAEAKGVQEKKEGVKETKEAGAKEAKEAQATKEAQETQENKEGATEGKEKKEKEESHA